MEKRKEANKLTNDSKQAEQCRHANDVTTWSMNFLNDISSTRCHLIYLLMSLFMILELVQFIYILE
jgi:type IV secretory pathway component VirB8